MGKGNDEQLVRLMFGGDPPRINFALTKLTNGINVTDMMSEDVSALGAGELAKIVTDSGESLRRTLEATLKGMKPYQTIEVVIMVLPEAGFRFVGPSGGGRRRSGLDNIRFALMGDVNDDDIHVISPKDTKRKTSKDDNTLGDKPLIIVQPGKDIIQDFNQDKNIFGTVAGDPGAVIIDDDDDLNQD